MSFNSTFLTREAVLSSQIEGTQATLDEVLKKEAEEGDTPREDSEKTRDIREILNYRRALRTGTQMIDTGESLTENNVKKLHKTLLESVRGKTRGPGEFRRQIVYIAPPGTPMEEARYVPPPAPAIPNLYSNFDKYLNTRESEHDSLVQIAVAHYQFEAIHPFKDGNGRMGRLLIPLFLYSRKIIVRPLVYISQYFEENRQDYYNLLAAVSYENAWIPWIRFFLNGLCEQADDACELARKVIALRDEYQKHLAEFNSAYAFNLLDAIFAQPYFSTSSIRKTSGIRVHQTLLNIIAKFVEADILRDISPNRQRNKIYAFVPLLNLLDKHGY
ncbi:Fic family protein [Candidatus Wolfebacteria bacterium]|nr:Fic family protein [Candidatus Wolfebacteria bacterium]